MNYSKKAIASFTLAAFMLSPLPAAAASPSDFPDFPSDWSTEALTEAVKNGLLSGIDGKIEASGSLTRAQMATIINRTFGAHDTASLAGYTDVADGAWYYDDMAKAVQMGTFVGADGKLNPDKVITRQEAFAVLSRAFLIDELSASDAEQALSAFSDADEISVWAKSALGAMVQAGYVGGSGGKLNPQSTITRAEFAAVMHKMTADYIDASTAKSNVIDGNAIIRNSQIDLSGMTIEGDLIIADGAENVNLDGVTIKGRLIVRGAGEGLTLKDITAETAVVYNPTGSANLNADGCTLGTVTVRSDVTLDGSYDTIVVDEQADVTVAKDGSVETITVTADGVTVGGEGEVKHVDVNADNVQVNTDGTEVRAADGSKGVTADGETVAPGESVTVGGGGTSSGSGGNGGSTVTPAPEGKIVDEAQTKLVNLTNVGDTQYVTVQFTDGHSLKDSTLTVDGVDVTKAFTPVSDDGTLVKWEITDYDPAQLVITSGSDSQTVTLSDNANPKTPSVVTNTAPDYLMAHGPVALWDYYLTNYDKDGNVRVRPEKTTFAIDSAAASEVPASYSPQAEISADGSGEVTIMFNYNTDAEKAWFDAIDDGKAKTVQLVAYNENQNTLNDNLQYTKTADVTHGSGKVGTLTIALGQTNFTSNGRYYVRVTSAGHETALVPIHVVNEKAPSLQLSGSGGVTSGKNVHFTVKDMTYGITIPPYAAELTGPDGQTVSLEKIEDWYLLGDTFVLYNDNTNHIPYNGTYTLTVHSNGFKDMTKSFTVSGGKDVPNSAPVAGSIGSVDAISSATSGGGTGGESGDGSSAISANLKFDADLLINAQLITKLGIENSAAQGIADRWEYDMAGWDTVTATDGKTYSYSDYINASGDARTQGEYLSFSEFAESAAEYTGGSPYSIKEVLEDNLLGDIQTNGDWIGQDAPALALVDSQGEKITAVKEGDEVILKADDADYFKKLERINLNNNALDMDKTAWTVDGDTLTIDTKDFKIDERNTLALYADGYKSNLVSVLYEHQNETGLTLSVDKESYHRGENVVVTVEGSDGDFAANLSAVTVHKPDGKTSVVGKKGYYSENEYYIKNSNEITIVDKNGKLFDQNGDYHLSLEAIHYNKLESPTFTVTGEDSPEPGNKPAPSIEPSVQKTEGGTYLLTFEDLDSDWSRSTVTVNGTPYTKTENILIGIKDGEYNWGVDAYGNPQLELSASAMTEGANIVALQLDGYDTYTVSVNADGGSATPEPGDDATAPSGKIEFVEDGLWGDYYQATFENDSDHSYINAITGISVNGTAYTESPLNWLSDNEYYINEDTGAVKLSDSALTNGKNTIVITADGYKDQTITYSKDGGSTEVPDAGDETAAPAPIQWAKTAFTGLFGGATLTFDNSGDEAVTAYLDAMTSVTVGDTKYEASEEKPSDWTQAVYQIHSGGTDQSIEFGTAALTGDTYTIVIKAYGYKDLTLKITGDNSFEVVE